MDPISDAKEFFEVAMTPVLQACSRSDASPSAAAAPTAIEAFNAAADSLHVEAAKVGTPAFWSSACSHAFTYPLTLSTQRLCISTCIC